MADKQQHSPEMDSARNLADAANSENSLQGYAAMNSVDEHSEIAHRAHEFWLERRRAGREGSADDDWFRAEMEVRRNRMERNVA